MFFCGHDDSGSLYSRSSIQYDERTGMAGQLMGPALSLCGVRTAAGHLLTYGHYQQIPMELEEAARMDGCGVIRMFLYIFLPLAKPVISTIGILTAISVWNEFIFANIIISDPLKKTLPVGLLALKGTYNTNYAAVSAALTISAIPIIIVYILMSGKDSGWYGLRRGEELKWGEYDGKLYC